MIQLAEKPLNIDLVWYFDKAPWVYPLYRDGVRAAMEELKKRGHTVRWHLGLDPEIPKDSDFILLWDSSNSDFIDKLKEYKQRKGLILTTDLGINYENLKVFDVIYPEVQFIADNLRSRGFYAIKAFGTDTDFFRPEGRRKVYNHIFPSTFSPWKRQNVFATMYGASGLCVGTIQPDGTSIFEEVVQKGTHTIVGYIPVEALKVLYDMSKEVTITAWEGSGRTVLEALSMGLPVSVADDNAKCQSYIKELNTSGLSGREFVETYYSAEVYSDNLLKGMYA